MDYTIKDVCRKLDLTPHTVRHYCDMGLVPNLRHDRHGNRLFDEQSVNWLKAAAFLRASGLSIPETRHYFELCQNGTQTISQRKDILIQMKEQAEKDLAFARQRIDCISEKIKLCQDVIDGKCEDDCNPLNW